MNLKEQLTLFLEENSIDYELNISLKKKTYIKRGGTVSIWITPKKTEDFKKVIIFLQNSSAEYEVIGSTTNSYFLNEYNPEIVVSTLGLKSIKISDTEIECDCGYNMVKLTKYCVANGIEGYEGFISLPGTVGGAAINNSGCRGCVISEVVKSVEVIENGKVYTLTNKELKYSQRNSILKRQKKIVVAKVVFDISKKGDAQKLEEKAKKNREYRMQNQEHSFPNLGTIYNTLKFKKLPLIPRIAHAVIYKTANKIIKNKDIKRRILLQNFLLFRRMDKDLKMYISEYGIQCFIWRDEKADLMFYEYMNFINKNTIEAEMEIEIKNN